MATNNNKRFGMLFRMGTVEETKDRPWSWVLSAPIEFVKAAGVDFDPEVRSVKCVQGDTEGKTSALQVFSSRCLLWQSFLLWCYFGLSPEFRTGLSLQAQLMFRGTWHNEDGMSCWQYAVKMFADSPAGLLDIVQDMLSVFTNLVSLSVILCLVCRMQSRCFLISLQA